MAIKLADLFPIQNPKLFKVHFARWNGTTEPLDALARSTAEWQEWQEWRPQKNEFNRPKIFSLARFYSEPDVWLFGGIFDVLDRSYDRYVVTLTDQYRDAIGRLKIHYPLKHRVTRARFESYYDLMHVHEIAKVRYEGQPFPGFENVDLPFSELETIVRNAKADWRAALANAKGVYLITDDKTAKRYVGSAYGEIGIWARWQSYIETGHGGNIELKQLVSDPTLSYCRENFRLSLLEYYIRRTPEELIIQRESYWKKVFLSRGSTGLNRN